ncbi:MAG: hypothetical protein ABSC54_01715 [Smithellaceae bacterium]|jgi:hypothetical protein
MVNKIDQNSLINPKRFLTNFYEKMASYPKGPNAFLKARDNEKDLEIWAVSIILIGLNKITNKPWWIQKPKPKDDPPDAFSVSYKIEKESNLIEYVPIEVVFVPEYIRQQSWDSLLSDEQNIYNFLNDKKFNFKSYEQGTHLVVYFNIKLDKFDLAKLSNLISEKNPKFAEIWFILSTDPIAENMLIEKTFPERLQITIRLEDCLLKDIDTITKQST